jgi:hypothetical protein
MLLPDSSNGWRAGKRADNASLDRIDSQKGYLKGNVRFVALMANLARADFRDRDLLIFCRAVVAHRR